MTGDDRLDRLEAGGLARRIVPSERLDDLEVPARTSDALRAAARIARGPGSTVLLFAGRPGTGKALATEALASELGRNVYRVDLSGLVSKYIGETEKNLRAVFDAAEQARALLLFDQADALFGRRSEVNDSHDRFANIDLDDLLQRLEQIQGVVVLTAKSTEGIDPTFLDRFQQVIRFSDGGARARREE